LWRRNIPNIISGVHRERLAADREGVDSSAVGNSTHTRGDSRPAIRASIARVKSLIYQIARAPRYGKADTRWLLVDLDAANGTAVAQLPATSQTHVFQSLRLSFYSTGNTSASEKFASEEFARQRSYR